LHGTAFADGSIVRWGTKLGGADAGSFGGPAFGLHASGSLAKFTLSAEYVEGRLQLKTGSPPDSAAHDLVEARMVLGVQPVPWLALGVGPTIRAFVTDSETVRWVLWQVRARAQGPLPSTPLETYVELWYALSAKVNLPAPVDHVQGAKPAFCCDRAGRLCGSGSATASTGPGSRVEPKPSRSRPSVSPWGSGVAERPDIRPHASAGRRRQRVGLRHQAVEDLAPADHAELLPGRALLCGRVSFEGPGQPGERVELNLEIAHRPALLDELAAQLQPVHRAVLSRLKREPREHDGAGDAGEAGAGHRPYRSRPG